MRKNIENINYDLIEGLVRILCDCGEEVWVDYDEPVSCPMCGRTYDLWLKVSGYEED